MKSWPSVDISTDTSDEAAQNDWLAVVRSAAAAAQPACSGSEDTSDKGKNDASTNASIVSDDSSASLTAPDARVSDAEENGDLLESLHVNLSEAEIAAYHSRSANQAREPSVMQPELPDDKAGRPYPNYDALRDVVIEPGAHMQQPGQQSASAQSAESCGNSIGAAREEHRRSSKARAYLNQVLEQNKDSDEKSSTVDGANSRTERNVSPTAAPHLSRQSNSNCNELTKNYSSLQRSNEALGESKGSLLDLKRFFLDDNDDEQK